MRLGPDERYASCPACREIAYRFNQGYAEAYERSKPASEALYRLIGGTEDDAKRAERFVGAYEYQSAMPPWRLPNWFREAMQKAFEHTIRTGHRPKPGFYR
ncbi:MAG TPA: hypothetical protein VEJ67_15100 [Candidatus Cybelea sp.]|nr:hypothetical protein [Candidatus Cybelea sp.]